MAFGIIYVLPVQCIPVGYSMAEHGIILNRQEQWQPVGKKLMAHGTISADPEKCLPVGSKVAEPGITLNLPAK